MKTIYFIPNYWYESLELFKELSLCLDNDVKKVFLETGDPFFQSSRNDKYTSDFFSHYFNAAFFLDYPERYPIKIIYLWRMWHYKLRLNKIINENKPDLIITTGDRNNFYFILKRLCPGTPIVIMQGALLHTHYYKWL